VLDALGEHLSNAEIGAKLFISERTVESHVSSLLRKLGATDRRELADLATRLTYVDGAPTARPIPSPLNPPWSPGCGWPTSFPAGCGSSISFPSANRRWSEPPSPPHSGSVTGTSSRSRQRSARHWAEANAARPRQLRARGRRCRTNGGARAQRVPAADCSGNQPGPADGAVRMGVPRATVVSVRRRWQIRRRRPVHRALGSCRPASTMSASPVSGSARGGSGPAGRSPRIWAGYLGRPKSNGQPAGSLRTHVARADASAAAETPGRGETLG
jgi:hypothetical protein